MRGILQPQACDVLSYQSVKLMYGLVVCEGLVHGQPESLAQASKGSVPRATTLVLNPKDMMSAPAL
jgi:hypothetical protein